MLMHNPPHPGEFAYLCLEPSGLTSRKPLSDISLITIRRRTRLIMKDGRPTRIESSSQCLTRRSPARGRQPRFHGRRQEACFGGAKRRRTRL
jgi:hypothetical protein